jgi:biotin carboxylase
MGKKILILTASAWQEPVIEAAKSMGLLVVVTDRNAKAPALPLADYPEVVDTLDLEAVLRIAQAHKVDGVIAEQTDVAVPTAAYVAEKMGLPGIGYDVALSVTDKWRMREKCRQAGIPGPRYRRVETADDAVAAADEIGLPVIVKPVDAQASRGVAKVQKIDEIPKWFDTAKTESRSGFVLVEELMIGVESSAEAFVVGDSVSLFGICDKTKCSPPYTFDTRLVYPAAFPPAVLADIKAFNERVIRALGISLGITHAEYIITERGVRLVEIAARGCGAGVVTKLIPAMMGADLIGARIRQALGEDAQLDRGLFRRAGILEFLLLPPGRVRSITGLTQARRIPGIVEVQYNVRKGDTVGVIQSGDDRTGHLLAVADTREAVLGAVEEVKRTLRVAME